jgi:hypothetical protein
MNEKNSISVVPAASEQINDLQALEIDTFQLEEVSDLGVDANLSITTTSSTTSSSCG